MRIQSYEKMKKKEEGNALKRKVRWSRAVLHLVAEHWEPTRKGIVANIDVSQSWESFTATER